MENNRRQELFHMLLNRVEIPKFAEVSYSLKQPVVGNIQREVENILHQCPEFERIQEGQTVAITAGSREVAHMAEILRTVADEIKKRGAIPFIVPAMGSHGGADADGQTEILRHYGITEESTGAAIRSSMETVYLGKTENGFDVFLDKNAMEADHIIPIGRIKAHTDFRGKVESGIVKMMVIGLGKQQGASICHKLGFPNMGENLLKFAKVILEKDPILLGIGIIENASHDTALIEAVPSEKILDREPELLEYSKSLMMKIPFDNIDVLIVSQMGKEISGAGMDPNVTGRSCVLGESSPHAEKIAVLDLTEKSEGNAAGMGNADAITQRMYDKIDTLPIYVNGITCRDTQGTRIPVIMPDDELAIKFCLYTCVRRDAEKNARVVWIKNTADLSRFWISESLMEEAKKIQGIQLLKAERELKFSDTV